MFLFFHQGLLGFFRGKVGEAHLYPPKSTQDSTIIEHDSSFLTLVCQMSTQRALTSFFQSFHPDKVCSVAT